MYCALVATVKLSSACRATKVFPDFLVYYRVLFTGDYLNHHSRASTGVANKINDASVVFKPPSKSHQRGSKQT